MERNAIIGVKGLPWLADCLGIRRKVKRDMMMKFGKLRYEDIKTIQSFDTYPNLGTWQPLARVRRRECRHRICRRVEWVTACERSLRS